MNFDYAFIVTYGRSGSTLLQGVLNTIPGAEIRGENGHALYHLFRTIEALKLSRQFAPAAQDPTHPWFGADRIDHEGFEAGLVAQFRASVMADPALHSLVGFKEIRYQTAPYHDLCAFGDFLRRHFARAAIIINTRDLDEVLASNQRAKHQVSEVNIRAADENFRRYAQEFPDHSHHVHYDDYVADPARLADLFAFLGAPMDDDAVAQVMGRTHSVRTRA